MTTKKWSKLTNGGHYSRSMNWKVHFDGQAFGGVDTQMDDILYIEQLFDHDPGMTDRSISRGDPMAALGSFVLDTGYDSCFFQSGSLENQRLYKNLRVGYPRISIPS